MSEPHASPRSWWTTLPGVLTGIAALVTAGTGLLVALVQGGMLGPGHDRRAPAQQVAPPGTGPTTPAAPLPPVLPPSSTASSTSAAADGVPPLVLRETIDLGSMSVQVLDVQRNPAPNALRVRVAYRIQAGEQPIAVLYFHDLLRLVADGAPRSMVRSIIQPRDNADRYVHLLALTAVDVTSEFIIPPAEELVLLFTELLPNSPLAITPAPRGERTVRRRIAP
jgi:hypothetical protein